jgi:ribosome biogenesis protein BRX1
VEEEEVDANMSSESEDEDSPSSADPNADNMPTEEEYAILSGVSPALVLPGPKSTGQYINKQRCLVLASRGITPRHRHLLEDVRSLIPHHKKDSKLDEKQNIQAAVLEIAAVKSCNSVIFLEARKRQDVYLWASLTPNGPSCKFCVSNVHTMDELKLTGNGLKGSRPLLSFDSSFETKPHMKVIKELLVETFGIPRGHPKSKPFVDRVMTFYMVDGKVWVRNYQISEEQAANAKEAREKKLELGIDTSLIEIGPRFVLDPIRVFKGSFGGQTIWQNADYISPNDQRAERMKIKGGGYQDRIAQKTGKKERKEVYQANAKVDPLGKVFR